MAMRRRERFVRFYAPFVGTRRSGGGMRYNVIVSENSTEGNMRKKKTGTVLLLLILCLICGGCMGSPEENRDEMISYMEKKYDREFTFSGYFGGHMGASERKILVTCSQYPERNILVRASETDQGKVFADNFVAVARQDETTAYVREAFSAVYGDTFLIFEEVQPTALPDTISLQDPITALTGNPQSALNFYFYLPENADFAKKDANLERLRAEFERKQIITDGLIHYCESDEEYQAVNAENYRTAFNTERKRSSGFIIDKDYRLSDVRWR